MIAWWFVGMGCSLGESPSLVGVETCASSYWPTERVEPPVDDGRWTLRQRWWAPLDREEPQDIVAAALEDTDGNGEVGAGDRMDLVVLTLDGVWRVDGTTGAAIHLDDVDGMRASVLVAEVDALHPGPEIVIVHEEGVEVSDANQVYLSLPVQGLDPAAGTSSQVVDLDGDALFELVTGGGVYDVATGRLRFSFPASAPEPVAAADLDGDGFLELVVPRLDGTADVLGAQGDRLATCGSAVTGGEEPSPGSLAVGNLDADPELEIVRAAIGGIVVCDADGTVLASSPLAVQGGAVSLAQLDPDPEPEVVVALGGPMSGPVTLLALQHDLLPLPDGGALGHAFGYSLADLDEDGYHEVVAWSESYASITDPTGTPVAWLALDPKGGSASESRTLGPAVVNLDDDPGAELVVSEHGAGGIVALDNARGGWSTRDADLPWRSRDHHPDAMRPDGRPGAIDPVAVAAGHDVWNARPATPPECSRAVTLEIRDLCVTSCGGESTLVVYVHNAGVLPLATALSLELRAAGEVVGTTALPDVPGRTAVPVRLVAETASLRGAVEVRLVGEVVHGCVTPTATRDEPICPSP